MFLLLFRLCLHGTDFGVLNYFSLDSHGLSASAEGTCLRSLPGLMAE